MKIDILTLFPEMFDGPFKESMIKRAQEKKLIEINIHNLRDWATDKHKKVDDKPFGGGPGMVLRVDVVAQALSTLRVKGQESKRVKERMILLSPQGKVYKQKKARELSKLDHLVLIAGHYEGFDQRIREHLVDEEISIGDYVLTGGEIPAMVVVDSVVRLIPGVIGDPKSLESETHSQISNLKSNISNKKYPVYTRPEKFKNWSVPEVLLSGNHKEIEKWRRENSASTK